LYLKISNIVGDRTLLGELSTPRRPSMHLAGEEEQRNRARGMAEGEEGSEN